MLSWKLWSLATPSNQNCVVRFFSKLEWWNRNLQPQVSKDSKGTSPVVDWEQCRYFNLWVWFFTSCAARNSCRFRRVGFRRLRIWNWRASATQSSPFYPIPSLCILSRFYHQKIPLVSLEERHGILELSPDSSGILLHTWAWSPWSLAIVASVAAQAALAAWVSSAPSPDHLHRLHPSSKSFKPHPDWKKETFQNTHVSCNLQTSFEVLATSTFTVCHGNLIKFHHCTCSLPFNDHINPPGNSACSFLQNYTSIEPGK